MGIFRSRTAKEPTLDERFNIAQALHYSAVSIFRDVVHQLDEASDHYTSVAGEAQEEIARLIYIRNEAQAQQASVRKSTDSILNLVKETPKQ